MTNITELVHAFCAAAAAEAQAQGGGEVCIWCGDKPDSADYIDPLTLRGLIEYVRVAANPNQGAMRWHALNLLAQALPHLRRLESLTAPPSAPVGVEEIWDAPALPEKWDSVRGYVEGWNDCRNKATSLAQQPAAVDGAMVERALSARLPNGDSVRQHITSAWDQTVMRAALTAALAQLQGENT